MKIIIPVHAVREDGEDGDGVMPDVGETITLPDVVATVTSVDGDNVEVEIKSVGGCDCAEDDKGEKEEAEPTEESVMKAAMEEDGE